MRIPSEEEFDSMPDVTKEEKEETKRFLKNIMRNDVDVRKRKLSSFTELLADVNAPLSDGDSLVHRVAREGRADVLRVLLEYGADVNRHNAEDMTVAAIAARHGHNSLLLSLESFGFDPLELLAASKISPAYFAVQRGDVHSLEWMTNAGLDISKITVEGWTLASTAASRGHAEMIAVLGRHGVPMTSQVVQNGQYLDPTWIATLLDDSAVIHALARNGVNLSGVAHPDADMNLVDLAVDFGNENALRALGSLGLDLNRLAAGQFAPIHRAIFHDRLDIVNILLELGVDFEIPSEGNYTPIHIAVAKNYPHIVKALAEFGANVNAAADDAQTPLSSAVYGGFDEVARVLRSFNAVRVDPTNDLDPADYEYENQYDARVFVDGRNTAENRKRSPASHADSSGLDDVLRGSESRNSHGKSREEIQWRLTSFNAHLDLSADLPPQVGGTSPFLASGGLGDLRDAGEQREAVVESGFVSNADGNVSPRHATLNDAAARLTTLNTVPMGASEKVSGSNKEYNSSPTELRAARSLSSGYRRSRVFALIGCSTLLLAIAVFSASKLIKHYFRTNAGNAKEHVSTQPPSKIPEGSAEEMRPTLSSWTVTRPKSTTNAPSSGDKTAYNEVCQSAHVAESSRVKEMEKSHAKEIDTIRSNHNRAETSLQTEISTLKREVQKAKERATMLEASLAENKDKVKRIQGALDENRRRLRESAKLTASASRRAQQSLLGVDPALLSSEELAQMEKHLPNLQVSITREILKREMDKKASNDTDGLDDALDPSSECIVCLAGVREVAFNCGHLCVCNLCAPTVVNCPVCREPIFERRRIFHA